MLQRRESIRLIQQRLGYTSIQVTLDRYGHLLPETHDAAAERLDEMLFGLHKVARASSGVTL